jgi:hypothetical protein
MSDKNLEQRVNIKFCVEIDKSASGTSALITFAYSEHAAEKLTVQGRARRCGRSKQKGYANADRV